MTLIKSTLWTSLSTFIKVLAVYATWKVIAVYTGPSGLAVIEQFQNFIQICRSFSCSLNQGVIKYVAEYKHDAVRKARILSSALMAYFIISVVVSIFLFLFRTAIANNIFHSIAYKQSISLLSVSIILYALNNFFLSVLNGELEIKKYVSCNIINTLFILIVTIFLIMHYGIWGGLVGFILNQSLVACVTGYFVIRSQWFKLGAYVQGIDKASIFQLIHYAIISFTPILIVPLSSMILRKCIVHELSWQEAGYWQGIMKLSDGYLILMELVISVYFLPKISGTNVLSALKAEIFNIYRLIVPIALLGLTCVFLFKQTIVSTVYSEQFFPMLTLFKYQLIGDFTRILAWVLTSVLAAKAMVKILVFSEVTMNIVNIVLTFVLVRHFGLIGSSISFAINNIVFLLLMIFFSLKCIRNGSFKLISSELELATG